MLASPRLLSHPGALLDVVRAAAADRALWQGAVRFDTRERYWSLLARSDELDVWLLTWLPGQQTRLHDHGDAAAAVTVLSGAVVEVRADEAGTMTQTRLVPGDAVWVPPGSVHDVRHAGVGPAVTLHAYAPRLTRMTFYEAGPGGLHPVRTVESAEPEIEELS